MEAAEIDQPEIAFVILQITSIKNVKGGEPSAASIFPVLKLGEVLVGFKVGWTPQ